MVRGRRRLGEVNTKQLRGLKVSDKGEVEAVFATLGVIDLDGDVTKPGAFEEGAAVKISAWNHGSWGSQMPVGRGTIREQGDQAILTGKFFLDTQRGRDTFTTVKESGDLMEWRYGYDILESSPPARWTAGASSSSRGSRSTRSRR